MKIGILGAKGRMGQMLIAAIIAHPDITLGAAVDQAAAENITTDTGAAFQACDVLIDFTSPAALPEHIKWARQYKKPLVIGTTGLTAEDEAALQDAAKDIPVFYAANMSLGVNVLAALVEQAAAKLNEEFDIEIFDAHHRHKVDAPSGTALLLGRAAASGRGVTLEDKMTPARHGQTGPRESGAIGMSVFRGGDVVGEHIVTFAGDGERIELAHKASDREIFVHGAIKAALWLAPQNKGFYTMRDMLKIALDD